MTIDWNKTLVLTATVQALCTESDYEEIFNSSKILLSNTFSELKFESGTPLHYVQLCLTSSREIVVLKIPTDKSTPYSFLRRHKVYQSEFDMHKVFYNVLTVLVPHTVIKHAYQCSERTTKTVKDWLDQLCCCCCKENDSQSKLKIPKEIAKSAHSLVLSSTGSGDQPTSHQHADESLLSYSSPSRPVSPKSIEFNEDIRPASSPSQLGRRRKSESAESLGILTRILDTQTPVPFPLEIVQLPSGLIKARSFQGRTSVKERFVRSSSTISGLNELERSRTPSESSTPRISTPPRHFSSRTPSPSTEINPFKSHLHHTQIRNRKWKYSPRINRNNSVQVDRPNIPIRTAPDQCSRSANSTPTPGEANPLPATTASRQRHESSSPHSRQSTHFFTLPRRIGKKSNSHDGTSIREDATASTPTTSLSSSIKTPLRSPNLLKMLHRRWQSSSGIKVSFNDNEDETWRLSTSDSSEGVTTQPPTPIRKLHQYSPKEVAEELSLMDAELLRKISPKELENGAWTKKNKEKMAPNVMSMIFKFNQLALLITSEILDEKTAHDRAKVISRYIQIASKCYSQHNYNSLKAVLAALQSTPIFRLTKTWKQVPSKRRKRFKQLSCLMSEEENWQLYKEEINWKLVSGTPFVPFLGQFLTQIMQTESYIEIRQHRMHSKIKEGVKECIERKRSSSLNDCGVHSTTSIAMLEPLSATENGKGEIKDAKYSSFDDMTVHSTTTTAISKPLLVTKIIKDHGKLTRYSYFNNCTAQSSTFVAISNGKTSQANPDNSSPLVSRLPVSLSAPGSPLLSHSLKMVDSSQTFLQSNYIYQSKSLSFDGSCPLDQDKVSNGSPNDSGHHSSSSHGDYRDLSLTKSSSIDNLSEDKVKAEASLGNSEVDINQIYVSLKRNSQSCESLLDSYTDNDSGLRNVLHNTLVELSRLSKSLQSLDSVFSDDENELNTSINQTYSDLDSDLEQTNGDNSPGPQDDRIMDSQIKCSTNNVRRTLFRAESDNAQHCYSISSEPEQCKLPLKGLEQENSGTKHTAKTKDNKQKFKLRRSLDSSKIHRVTKKFPKVNLRSKHRKLINGSNDLESYETYSSAEMLNHYQVASLGCSVCSETNRGLRSAITDTEPNTESANYRLSLKREALD